MALTNLSTQTNLNDSDIDIFIYNDNRYADLPDDVRNAALTILTRLQGVTLHPTDTFTHDLLFSANIKDRLYLSLKCAYTDRNWKELKAFSKDIIASQPFMNVFCPTGWKQGQKRVCLTIRRWKVGAVV